MNTLLPFKPNSQSSESMKPGKTAFHHPASFPPGRFHWVFVSWRDGVLSPEQSAASDALRNRTRNPPEPSRDIDADGPTFPEFEEECPRMESLDDIRSIGAGQADCQRDATLIGNYMEFAARSYQSRSLCQQFIPEPHPISWVKSSQGIPVFITNKMPISADRFSTDLRPGYRKQRGFGAGRSGSIVAHNSSERILRAISFSVFCLPFPMAFIGYLLSALCPFGRSSKIP
jgi:hypothetical protein